MLFELEIGTLQHRIGEVNDGRKISCIGPVNPKSVWWRTAVESSKKDGKLQKNYSHDDENRLHTQLLLFNVVIDDRFHSLDNRGPFSVFHVLIRFYPRLSERNFVWMCVN